MPDALIAIGACSRDEPQPKFLFATIISPFLTRFTKSGSISSIQLLASSAGSDELRYLAGIITSVSTLSPYLWTMPQAFIIISPFLYCTLKHGNAGQYCHYTFYNNLCRIYNPKSEGCEILPVIALAAATAGLAR